MGTRHLIAAKIDGVYKLAQYGQWDGYPEGQGVAVLDFLVNKMDVAAFTAALRNCRFISNMEILCFPLDAASGTTGGRRRGEC